MSQFLKDEVKQRILDSSIEVFSEYGFNKTTIKMVSKNSGVSVGNIYRYFKNKNELFDELFQNVYDDMYAIMTREIKAPKNKENLSSGEFFDIAVMEVIGDFIVLIRRNKTIFNILLQGEKGDHYTKIIGMVLEIIKENMQNLWGQDSEIQAVTDIEISALANAVIFGSIDIINSENDEGIDIYLKKFLQKIVKGYFFYEQN